MADKQNVGTKTRVRAESKETQMARRLLQAAMDCKKQSCGSIHACEILCESLHCGSVKGLRAEMPNLKSARLWCPAHIRCQPVSCDENKSPHLGKRTSGTLNADLTLIWPEVTALPGRGGASKRRQQSGKELPTTSLRSSHYNHVFDYPGGLALAYNTLTGSLLHLRGEEGRKIRALLEGENASFPQAFVRRFSTADSCWTQISTNSR